MLLEMTAMVPVPVAVMGEAIAEAKDDTEGEEDCENCVFHEPVLSCARRERKSATTSSVINFSTTFHRGSSVGGTCGQTSVTREHLRGWRAAPDRALSEPPGEIRRAWV